MKTYLLMYRITGETRHAFDLERGVPASQDSEATLPLHQILQKRLVETHARIDGNIIDVGLGAFAPIVILKLRDRLQVVAAHALGVEHQLVRRLHILELDQPLEGEMNLGLIENVKQNDLIARDGVDDADFAAPAPDRSAGR